MKYPMFLTKPEIYFKICVVSVPTWLSPVLKKTSYKDKCTCQVENAAGKKKRESMLDISWCFQN